MLTRRLRYLGLARQQLGGVWHACAVDIASICYIYVTHTLRMLHQLGGVWHECVMDIAYSAQ